MASGLASPMSPAFVAGPVARASPNVAGTGGPTKHVERSGGRPASSPARLGGTAPALACIGTLLAASRRRRAAGRGLVRVRCDGASASPEAKSPEEPAAPARRERVLSGVQPTGDLHLGNYFGAIKQWVGMQEEYDSFFCVVDLHAITLPHNPKELRKATLSTAAAYLASGIDPDKSTIFVQSAVPEHCQLSWLLNSQTPMSWLKQMTQFKEKSRKFDDDKDTAVCLGLFAYPVLMAADILLYQADKVPVGEDQMEHLYLTTDLAKRINKAFKKTAPKKRRLFRIPEPLVCKAGARVMSLTDGTNKMSKSAPDPFSRINLVDSAKLIKKKVNRCKTDSTMGMELGNPQRPEASNLLKIYSLVTDLTPEEAAEQCKEDRWGDFKPKLAEALTEYLTPIQGEYNRLLDDEAYLRQVLDKGAGRAREVAGQTLKNVETAMGFGFL